MWLVLTVDWIIHDIQLETNKVKKKNIPSRQLGHPSNEWIFTIVANAFVPKRRWANWQPCWIYDYDYDFWRNDECGRCLPKRALSLLTITLDKYIHRYVSYPSETIQKLSDLLSLLSFMLFSSVPIGILVLESLIQVTGH